MKIIDVSAPIYEGMAVYKDKKEKQPEIVSTSLLEKNGAQESRISLDSHTGTHVDAPAHMVRGGKGIEAFGLAPFVGKCRVLDFTKSKERITAQDIAAKRVKEGERVLLRTRNSADKAFNQDFVFIDESAARELAKRKVSLVGIDALGIERGQEGHPTHKALLERRIPVLEGLRLAGVKEGRYFLAALPLRIEGIDAVPMRAVLIEGKI